MFGFWVDGVTELDTSKALGVGRHMTWAEFCVWKKGCIKERWERRIPCIEIPAEVVEQKIQFRPKVESTCDF